MKFFAGLEPDSFAGSDADLGTGSGIAADARLARLDGEDAKSSEFDSLACDQSPLHALEDGVDSQLGLRPGKSGTLDDSLDEVLLDHVGRTFPDVR